MPPPGRRLRPVALHFFDASVREVGVCVVHLPDAVEELRHELGMAMEEDAVRDAEDDRESDSSQETWNTTGRPAVDPGQVLELARQHLLSPTGAPVLQRLADSVHR